MKFIFILAIITVHCFSASAASKGTSKHVPTTNKKMANRVAKVLSDEEFSEIAEKYIVKVTNRFANVFVPETNGGHGTGFIVELTANKGVVFTNQHVIEKRNLDAQKIELSFPTDQGLAETIPGKVVFISPITDFAVIEFDPKQLKRAAKRITVADLASEEEFLKISSRGRRVMAFGYPLDGDNIATFGEVTGLNNSIIEGQKLQTSAPINPGNSGGPLVDKISGKVIGMNTAIRIGGNSVGYVVPITRELEDYWAWKNDPTFAHEKSILISGFSVIETDELDLEGSKKIIEKTFPDFFDFYKGLIAITLVPKGSKLQIGDLILKVNGEFIGDKFYDLRKMVQYSENEITLTVLRNGNVFDVIVPVVNEQIAAVKKQVDFVLISGLVFQEMNLSQKSVISPTGVNGVVLVQSVPLMAASQAPLAPGSMIKSIQIGLKTFEIQTLKDLKRALKTLKADQAIRMIYYPRIMFEGHDGEIELHPEELVSPMLESLVIPVDYVVTPKVIVSSADEKRF